MRHLRFLTLGLIVLFSCSRENLSVPENGGSGEVEIQLSVSDTETGIRPQTKAVEENVPVLDDFMVEIYDSKGKRIYRAPYQEAVAAENGLTLKVNSGEYRLLAQCRDSAGIGFDPAVHAWYAADSTFTVGPQEKKTVNATAKMMKVKVKVNHGSNIQSEYPEHYSVVKLIKGTDSAGELKFAKGETKSGYIPAGKLVYELYVKDPETQTLKYFHNDTTQYNPNDFVTFNVDVALGSGNTGKVTVTVEEKVNEIEKKYEIPSEAAPKDAPAITLDGFTPEKTFSFVEGVEYPGVQVNIAAMGKIKSFEISSQFLANKGITASAEEALDLASAALDPAKAEALRALGFNWGRSVAGNRLAVIGLESIGLKNAYDPASVFSGEFTLKVTDEIGKTATETFTLTQKLPTVVISAEPHNAFAKRMTGITATTADGNPDMISALEYSLDGKIWNSVAKTGTGSQGETQFADINGLRSDTEYKLRTIYNGNENSPSAVVTLRTETEAQIVNAGFEEWSDETFNSKYILTSKSIEWYRPWNPGTQSSAWWDTNSRATLHDYYSLAGNQNTRFFPCAAYTVNSPYAGTKSAMVYVTYVTSTEYIDQTTPGEIFIGQAGDDGSHTKEGHEFSSRPSGLKFAYKYDAFENDTFYAKIEMKSADGTVIASAEKSDFKASDSWITGELQMTYADFTKQAASIYIIFKSSSSNSPNTRELAMNIGNNKTYSKGCYIGSILYLDSLELVY